MTRPDVEDLKAALASSREELLRAIAGINETQFKQRPAASDAGQQPWCIAEVLAHLLSTDLVWTRRIDLALRDDGASVEPTDPALAEAQVRAGRSAPVPQLVLGLLGSQREFDKLIDRADSEDGFGRAIEHSARGRITVEWMLTEYALNHLREHAGQIEALRQLVGATPLGATP